jgi:hypothetical protein
MVKRFRQSSLVSARIRTPEAVLSGVPGFNCVPEQYPELLAWWRLNANRLRAGVVELPCHPETSPAEAELLKSDEFAALLSTYNISVTSFLVV